MFADLGASERKGGRKHKEGFVVAAGLQALLKLLQTLQSKLSEEEKELLQYKDNKLTYMLRGLYKEYTKVNVLFHVGMSEGSMEGALKTLESADRLKNVQLGKGTGDGLNGDHANEDGLGQNNGEVLNLD